MLEEYADILTVEEVCEALRIGENAAYALLGSGQLKTDAPGGSPRNRSAASFSGRRDWDKSRAKAGKKPV